MRNRLTPRASRILIPLLVVLAARLPAQDAAPATAAAPAPAVAPMVENSVVKIFSTTRYPDTYKPWTKQSPREGSGTGVVIEGKRILTNAHVVLYASQVQVQAHQSGDKLPATVEFIDPGIDLAVLKLEDESFFATHAPLPRAPQLPGIKDNVMVYGYPTGGTSLSITKGIVSRIDFANYNYPVSGLRIQIDAAINPGNSGGPALNGDVMIGLAFSRLNNADNIGYIIPNEEIELFLKDIADGRHDGKPALFDELQSLENPALRAFLQLDKTVEGIVVSRPASATADHPLREWDVITRIGDTPVDNEGMIKLGDNLRVRFTYLVQRLAKNGRVPITIVRKQKELKLDLTVAADRPLLIPDLEGAYPAYFVYGPLVFSSATGQFLAPLSSNARALASLALIGSPLATRRGEPPAFAGEELVLVASPFFPHRLSKGYDNPMSRVVQSINGIDIKNLRHLVEVLRDTKEKFITIEFSGRGSESIVFDRQEMVAATEEILSDNGVREQASAGLLDVWKAKPAKQAASPFPLKRKGVGTMARVRPRTQKQLAKPARRYSLKPMSAHNLTRDYQNPVVPRLDDDDDEAEATPKPTPTPVGAMIQKKFLEQRKIFLWGAVTDETAKDLTEKLLYLETTGPGKEITFYMNTPGGSITAGMAVYDTIKLITSPVKVVVTGMAASMGSILLSAAKKGNRYIYPHARVLIHQPLITGRMVGPASDINIQAKEMEKLRMELNQILATASGQSFDKVAKDSDRDFYLNAEESIAYGLADHIVDKV